VSFKSDTDEESARDTQTTLESLDSQASDVTEQDFWSTELRDTAPV